ncbi:MAG TPA: prepilin-type N-terminal cleavage/methylation domain-containing protein [Verrucomicrobiae bacterium]
MNPRRAFTLIELLVVIAIIVILAALLLPALNNAKNDGAKTTDLSNFHQIMAAIHIYTTDNRDSLTWPNWDYGRPMPNKTTPPGWLYEINPSASGPAAFNAQAGLLWNVLHGGKILLCPMDNPTESYPPDKNGKITSRAEQLSSYIMNGAVIGFRTGYRSNAPPVKISQMNAGDCLFWEADDRIAFAFNDGSSWPLEGVTARHANGATWAAIDGSSRYIRDLDWTSEAKDTNKNSLWCFPLTPDGGDRVYGHDR